MAETGTEPLISTKEFINLNARSYLYTGAHSPALGSADAALTWAYREKSRGPLGRDTMFAAEEQTRDSIARLVGMTAADVGLLGDASTAWSAIANGWKWRPGDNIVINEYEHPSVFAPWLRLADQGLEVRVARRLDNWDLPAESIESVCDERTVAIALSHVGYMTGLRHDLSEIAEIAERYNAPLLVDISHSAGVVPIDLSHVALAVSASYKWMLGPYGVGVVIWNRDRLAKFEPGAVGWRSLKDIFTDRRFSKLNWNADATRFQMGAPAFAEIAALGAGVDTILGLGIDVVAEHSLTLTQAAHGALSSLGVQVVTPADRQRHAGNVAFLHPQGELFADRLAEKGILLWGGDGRVRASFHVMNCLSDVSNLVDAVEATLTEMPLEEDK